MEGARTQELEKEEPMIVIGDPSSLEVAYWGELQDCSGARAPAPGCLELTYSCSQR